MHALGASSIRPSTAQQRRSEQGFNPDELTPIATHRRTDQAVWKRHRTPDRVRSRAPQLDRTRCAREWMPIPARPSRARPGVPTRGPARRGLPTRSIQTILSRDFRSVQWCWAGRQVPWHDLALAERRPLRQTRPRASVVSHDKSPHVLSWCYSPAQGRCSGPW